MNIILGPPGTGKTTRLLTLVENYMEAGVPPDRIGAWSPPDMETEAFARRYHRLEERGVDV